jgi:8-oxo-dGTP diphosphatase
MASPNFYAAVYAIIRNEQGEILFSQRKNTGFMDGRYHLPAGHMDGNETMVAAMIRELKEELDIDVLENDIRVVHISHRESINREYFDAYLEVSRFTGIPKINEPEKCSTLNYFNITAINMADFVMYDIDIINMIDNGVHFSDVDMSSYK